MNCSRRFLLDAVLLGCISVGVLCATARTALVPRDISGGVAVVFAPWVTDAAALTQTVGAGARFVRFGALPFVTVAMPESEDYAARVLHAGAWLVVDPKLIAACLAPFGVVGMQS